MGVLTIILAALAGLSFVLGLWQLVAALRFPLHRRISNPTYSPAVTVLKPLKGYDLETRECLRSWLTQNYAGQVQIRFGIASDSDPAVSVVKALLAEFPQADARLLICPESLGANAKVATLIQLAREPMQEIVIVSDADVRVPADFLSNLVAPFREAANGLVTCFYRLANPATLAMRCEAVAVNGDFWSQVLQARSLKPMDFALGAVMAVRREHLAAIGGFTALNDYLADDYQLGRLVAPRGRIALCPVVADCWESPQTWGQMFRHQLRWARTIRVCQPLPYFFSILSNGTLWPLLMLLSAWPLPVIQRLLAMAAAGGLIGLRMAQALYLQHRLTQKASTWFYDFLVPIKDLMQAVVWALAFLGDTIEWRGERYRVRRGGKLENKLTRENRNAR